MSRLVSQGAIYPPGNQRAACVNPRWAQRPRGSPPDGGNPATLFGPKRRLPPIVRWRSGQHLRGWHHPAVADAAPRRGGRREPSALNGREIGPRSQTFGPGGLDVGRQVHRNRSRRPVARRLGVRLGRRLPARPAVPSPVLRANCWTPTDLHHEGLSGRLRLRRTIQERWWRPRYR